MPNNEHERIEEMLSATQPQDLTSAERARIVAAVETGMQSVPVPSPYFPLAFTTPTMIPLALVLALFFGVGGTAVASDAARPGDFLFPVDRAIEDLRLSLSNDKEDLRIAFANERLNEFSSIVDEEFGDDLSEATLTEAEADIFTNETIVKLEAGDRKAVFSTDADTRAEIIAAIRTRFDFTETEIDAVLVVETEDRASTADDGAAVSAAARLRVEHALDVLNDFVLSARGAASTSPGVLTALQVLEAHLLERSSVLPDDIRMRVRDDRARFEIEDENGRTRVEIKDGEIRIKKDDHEDDDSDDREDDRDDSSSSALEIEADVFTDTTVVKVEQNDRKTTFSTDATTRAEIIAAILDEYPGLTSAEVDGALELEVEDRASRADDSSDSDSDSDDDSEDDTSGHGGGSDDDTDDDNSGHGGGHN